MEPIEVKMKQMILLHMKQIECCNNMEKLKIYYRELFEKTMRG